MWKEWKMMWKRKPKKSSPEKPRSADRLVLAEEITIFEVGALHRELCDRLANGRPLVLAGDAVRTLDTSAAQGLLAARKAWSDRGLSFTLSRCPKKMRDKLSQVGGPATLVG